MGFSAFPFIKLGYRLFSIDSGNTASIFCFAGVRFMLGSVLVLLGSILLQGKAPRLPRGRVAAECCALGLWQTTAQYAFYYIQTHKQTHILISITVEYLYLHNQEVLQPQNLIL